MLEPTIEVENFFISRNTLPLFEPLNFKAFPGEVISIVGGNGSGKSTFLRFIAGLRPEGYSYSGAYSLSFTKKTNFPDRLVRKGLMFVRQYPTIYKSLSVVEQLLVSTMESASILSCFSLSNKTKETEEILLEGLSEFDLSHISDLSVSSLSLGQLRALSLITVWVRLKMGLLKLLLLDEPTSGLDAQRKIDFTRLIDMALSENCSVIVAEHLIDDTSMFSKKRVEIRQYKENENASPI